MPRPKFPPKSFTCTMCGAIAMGKYRSGKYCPDCVHRRKIEAQRIRRERNKKPRTLPTKQCVVCGEPFYCQPRNQGRLKTCSPECEAKNRARPHEGEIWEQVEKRRVEGVLKSPKTGRFDTNIRAKGWKLQAPTGEIYEFRNLRLWVDENSCLYDGTPDQAYRGILCIKATLLGRRKRGLREWKGWRLLEWRE